jgi:ATPase subunit of ABC transporter with duplicated ATPase domains
MNLYEITKEYLEIQQILETEELTPELDQALMLNQNQLQTKGGGYAKIMANKQANVDGATAEMKRLKAYIEQEQKKIDRLKNAMLQSMLITGIEKLESDFWRFSVRRSESVEVDLVEALPSDFRTIKNVVTADKVAIKEAIKRGENVIGARLIENFNYKSNETVQIIYMLKYGINQKISCVWGSKLESNKRSPKQKDLKQNVYC